MSAGAGNLRHTQAELEAMATIHPARGEGRRKVRMGCPFHGSDRQRSLEVDLETGRYGCHNCGAWGYLRDHPGRERPPSSPGAYRRSDRSTDSLGRDRPGRERRKLAAPQEARSAPKTSPAVPQAVPGPQRPLPGRPGVSPEALGPYLVAARRHLGDPAALAYLEARRIPLDLARAHGLGYFPPGTWPGRKAARSWGRIAFPLQDAMTGELVGLYSRAVDPAYPGEKAPPDVRHDVWGRRGIFHQEALAGPCLFLTEGCFDALAMLGSGWPAAALVGTKGLPWAALAAVQELYLCLDLDESGEGQEAARELARQAALRGIRAFVPDLGAYGGHPEPSAQWEAEGRVTLAGLEDAFCAECKAPVRYYAPDGTPFCAAHGPGLED